MKERFLIFQEVPPPSPDRKKRGPEGPQSAPAAAPTLRAKVQDETAEATLQSREPLAQIKDVTPEKIETVRHSLKEALNWLKGKLKGKKMPANLKIDYDNPDRYLPLLIKENKLVNDKVSHSGAVGYFQLRAGAVADVNRFFYPKQGVKIFDTKATMDSVKAPLNNCIVGILFYHISLDHYANQPPFNSLPAKDREIAGYMMYNKGYPTIDNLWKLAGQKTFPDFERKFADELAVQIGGTIGIQQTVLDSYTNAHYKEYPVLIKYVELWIKKRMKDPMTPQQAADKKMLQNF